MAEKVYEAPNIRELEKDKSEAYVFESFHQLGFKIEEIPELYERLIELASMEKSHFEDAVKMAQMVDIIWLDLDKISEIKFDKNELKLACLFHDIGKSGPLDANHKQRRIIQIIFNPKYFNANLGKFKGLKAVIKDLTISEAIKLEDKLSANEKKEIFQYLETLSIHIYNFETKKAELQKLDLYRHRMIDLWREHDYWTWDLLKKYGNTKVPDDVKKVASTHHALEGHDPAEVDGFIKDENITMELLDKYLMITLLDKYQAWITRAGLSHHQAIAELIRQVLDSRRAGIIDEAIEKRFYKYLKIIQKYKDLPKIINS